MATSWNPRRRKRSFDPFQRTLSNFTVPRAGISKDAVNFVVEGMQSPFKKSSSSSQGSQPARSQNAGASLNSSGADGFLSASTYYEASQSMPKRKVPYHFGHQNSQKSTMKQSRMLNFVKVTEKPCIKRANKKPKLECDISTSKERSKINTVPASKRSPVLPCVESLQDSTVNPGAPVVSKNEDIRAQSPYTFGLLGDDDDIIMIDSDDEGGSCNIGDLPLEVMENILCQLPILDLMLNLSCVCRRWYEIIQNPNFIPWKKLYYKVKNNQPEALREVFQLLHSEQLLHEVTFVTNLSRFLAEFRKSNDVEKMLSALKLHPKYNVVAPFVEDCSLADKNVNPWSLVGLLCMVSTKVRDIQLLIQILTQTASCLVNEVLECMYCLAAIFFALKSEHKISPGFHYRVFYAVYLFENTAVMTNESLSNALSGNNSGQQSIQRYGSATDTVKYTHEQIHIVNHNVKDGEVIKIVAFAGTGKTTTLVRYTQTRPGKNFLNVTYNKSVQENNVKIFPMNVTCKTFHSLAYKSFGSKFRHKMASGIHVNSVVQVVQKIQEKCNLVLAKRIVDTLGNYIASADEFLTTSHVPPYTRVNVNTVVLLGGNFEVEVKQKGQQKDTFNTPDVVGKIANLANRYWARMSDVADTEVRITHDGYLKLYQLSKPVIKGYDCLMVDEAQDITPALVDVLMKQKCAKIFVGDPNQQIYSFRGATNGLQTVNSTHTFYLTQSFRFGPEIAYVAAGLLDVLKGVRHKTLVGSSRPSGILGDRDGQLAIITRCNNTLFNEAVRICTGKTKVRVAFAGGIQGYQLDKVLDIYALFTGDMANVKDNFIRRFGSFGKLKTFAEAVTDHVLLGKIRIVEQHNVFIPARVNLIRSHTTGIIEHADIVFSTAHKSKGLEFDTVKVADDFLGGYMSQFCTLAEVDEDEKNLVYVAATRAKKRLILNPLLIRLLKLHEEKFVEPVSSQEAFKGTFKIECSVCNEPYEYPPDCPVVMQRQTVEMQGDKVEQDLAFAPGPLCPECVGKECPEMISLVLNTASL